jgi:ribosome-associated translation inhibitor RaiA
MKEVINNLEEGGGTNYYAAFDKAFDILTRSIT